MGSWDAQISHQQPPLLQSCIPHDAYKAWRPGTKSIFGVSVERCAGEALLSGCVCVCVCCIAPSIHLDSTNDDGLGCHSAGHGGQCALPSPAASRSTAAEQTHPQDPWPCQVKRLPEWQDHGLCCAGGRNEPFPCSGKMLLGSCGNSELDFSLPGSCCRAAASQCGRQHRVPVSACLTDMSSTERHGAELQECSCEGEGAPV